MYYLLVSLIKITCVPCCSMLFFPDLSPFQTQTFKGIADIEKKNNLLILFCVVFQHVFNFILKAYIHGSESLLALYKGQSV